MIVNQAYKFALDPTPIQERILMRNAGARRFAFNWAVARLRDVRAIRAAEREQGIENKDKTKWPTFFDLNTAFNAWKKTDDAPEWLGENSSQAYLWAIYEARDALTRHLDSWKPASTHRIGFPKFKSRKRDQPRYKVTGGANAARPVDSRHVKLPKLGDVRTHESMRKLTRRIDKGQAKVKNVTISRTPAGRWFVALSVEIERQIRTGPSARQRAGGTVGVDLGVRTLAVLSTGQEVANPRHGAKLAARLATAQHALARAEKGSKRRKLAALKVAKLHARIGNQRRDSIHKLISALVHAHDVVAIEDLNVKGMMTSARGTVERPGKRVRQKAGLNRSLADAAFAEIRRQLTYKTGWYGSRLAVVDRFRPTSKVCSACGWRHPNLTLAERVFTCGDCGLIMDRDLNAAHNIARFAQPVAGSSSETKNARRGSVSPSAPRGERHDPLKREARTAGLSQRVSRALPIGNDRASP